MSVSGFNKAAAPTTVNNNRVFRPTTGGTFSTTINSGFYAILNKNEVDVLFGRAQAIDSWNPRDYPNLAAKYGFNVSSTISSFYVSYKIESPTLLPWTNRFTTNTNFLGVAFGAGLFVATGNMVTSTDGITWTARSTPASSGMIVRGADKFVSMPRDSSSTTAVYSTDGITWATSAIAQNRSGLTYGNGTYVTVGQSGVIQSSTDGITWTSRTSGTTNQLRAVTFGNGIFLAGGESGTSRFSTDGITWTNANVGTGSVAITAITYGSGLFVAVASPGGSVNPVVRVSTTGNSDWVTVSSAAHGFTSTQNITSSSFFNGTYGFFGGANRGFTALDSATSPWESFGNNLGGDVQPVAVVEGNGVVVAVGSSSSGNPKIASAALDNPTGTIVLEYIADQTTL